MVYDALVRNRRWRLDCGWKWESQQTTKKVLDTLVRHELVEVDKQGWYVPKEKT